MQKRKGKFKIKNPIEKSNHTMINRFIIVKECYNTFYPNANNS